MLTYTINPKTRGINGFGLTPPDHVQTIKFDGTNPAAFTITGDLPMGAMGSIGSINPIGNVGKAPRGRNKYIAIIKYGYQVSADVWVNVNAAAVIPSTNSFVQGTTQLNPDAYEVFAGDIMNFACNVANQTISVALYNIKD